MNGAWLAVILLLVVLLWLVRRIRAMCEAANEVNWGSSWLNRLDGLNRLFCRKFHGLPNAAIPLPERGAVLVASNHVSGLDPLLLAAACRRPLRFLIAKEQYDRWWLRWLFRATGCIPVERQGNPRAALSAARRALAAGQVVALFPQGRMHLDHLPPIPLRRGIVLLSQMSGAPIMPVRIHGVSGQGFTVRAVFMRSRARLDRRPLLRCHGQTTEWCLAELSRALHGETSATTQDRANGTST